MGSHPPEGYPRLIYMMGEELAAAKEGKPHCVSTAQTSACALFANDLLTKESHVDRPRFKDREIDSTS